MAFSSDGLNYIVRKSGQLECENFYGFLQTELYINEQKIRGYFYVLKILRGVFWPHLRKFLVSRALKFGNEMQNLKLPILIYTLRIN